MMALDMVETIKTRWKNFIQPFIKDLEYLQEQDPKGCQAHTNCVGCPVHEVIEPFMNYKLGEELFACELFWDSEAE
jgi:hypothetical protein